MPSSMFQTSNHVLGRVPLNCLIWHDQAEVFGSNAHLASSKEADALFWGMHHNCTLCCPPPPTSPLSGNYNHLITRAALGLDPTRAHLGSCLKFDLRGNRDGSGGVGIAVALPLLLKHVSRDAIRAEVRRPRLLRCPVRRSPPPAMTIPGLSLPPIVVNTSSTMHTALP
jgi:hypothetical protein